MKLIGVAATVTLVLGIVFLMTAAEGRSGSQASAVVITDFHGLAAVSEVIVTGTVIREGATRNTARDPKDPTKEDPNHRTVAQDYVVAVDGVLKSQVGTTITVTTGRSTVVTHGERIGEFPLETFQPLTVGSRYALFLRRYPHELGVFVMNFEPSRFELGVSARVQSNLPDARQNFPEMSTDELLNAVRAAVSAGSR